MERYGCLSARSSILNMGVGLWRYPATATVDRQAAWIRRFAAEQGVEQAPRDGPFQRVAEGPIPSLQWVRLLRGLPGTKALSRDRLQDQRSSGPPGQPAKVLIQARPEGGSRRISDTPERLSAAHWTATQMGVDSRADASHVTTGNMAPKGDVRSAADAAGHDVARSSVLKAASALPHSPPAERQRRSWEIK